MCPVRYARLSPFVVAGYSALTFAAYRPLLERLSREPEFAAIGASVGGHPIGLALAHLETNRIATILSVYVRRDFRRRGVGRALLHQLEQLLADDGRETVVGFRAVNPAGVGPAVERFLEATGWPTAGDPLHYVTTDCRIMSCDWFDRAVLPPPFSMASWSSVTPVERSALDAASADAEWIPDVLNPTRADAHFDPVTSLVLRHRGAIVGWAITEPLPPDIVRYATVFAKPSLNRVGRTFATLALVAEAVRRQARAWGPFSRGRFEVLPSNTGFLRFIDRHLAGYVLERVETLRLCKRLGAPRRVAVAAEATTGPASRASRPGAE